MRRDDVGQEGRGGDGRGGRGRGGSETKTVRGRAVRKGRDEGT